MGEIGNQATGAVALPGVQYLRVRTRNPDTPHRHLGPQFDYSHRKGWVLERLQIQSQVFAIEICAYAVMSNHYHLVLYVDRARSKAWSLQEVAARWTKLYSAPPLITRWARGEAGQAECEQAEKIIEQWRSRLSDISWYMKSLNEHLARRANAEDGCTGRFWEGRFRSQALLDEAGLLTAMIYVDLNPIRAGIAATPEGSEFTSIYQRIQALRIDAHANETSSSAPPVNGVETEVVPQLRSFRTSSQRTPGTALCLQRVSGTHRPGDHWDTHQFPADLTRKSPSDLLTRHIYM